MSKYIQFPAQQLSYRRKTKSWRKQCVDWADSKTFFNYSPVRKSVRHKKINYDLLNGKIHLSDLMMIVNPEHLQGSFIPDNIPHYPIMNSKLNLLRGEESRRTFDFRVVVTNPNSISEIEENKKDEMLQQMQALIANDSYSEEEFNSKIEKMSDYFSYEWQDFREIRANALLNHFSKEQNFALMFNLGFVDAMTVAEEIYQCDIVGGEPVLMKLNPMKVRVFKSGYSNKIEDADIVIIEDYWSRGRVIDNFYDVLTEKDMKYIEKLLDSPGSAAVDSMGNIDERAGLVNLAMVGEEFSTVSEGGMFFDTSGLFPEAETDSLLPYDFNGNIRVIQMYWKSRRKIKKVKSYDPETGEETFSFYPEDYIEDTAMGEESQTLWINEAWEGTKIGEEVYVNMRPRPIQYNRLSNPSVCHFGIIGSIYNINDSKPFSLVDMMKQYNYLYDVVHYRLNNLMSHNWGKMVGLDIAKVPKGWDIDKWMYFARANGLYITDSFKEGNYGAATGKLAGGLNNNTSNVIDAEFGESIQAQINLLEFIKLEMSEIIGISRQREGQISNRETVGGVERANLQSSHITEWLFTVHDDVKRRVLNCMLETAKIAYKGRKIKFDYILPDGSSKIMSFDGDEFAENDYGLAVDSSEGMQLLRQQIETLAQAALQNQTLDFATIMKLYNSSSLAEKERLVANGERKMQERAEQARQQEMQLQQQQIQATQQAEMQRMQMQDKLNQRDNDTRIEVALINAEAEYLRFGKYAENDGGIQEPEGMTDAEKSALKEKIRQFDTEQSRKREELEEKKRANRANEALKSNKTKTS